MAILKDALISPFLDMQNLARKRSPPLARIPLHTLEFHLKTGARQGRFQL
jgi:hypothetical protein